MSREIQKEEIQLSFDLETEQNTVKNEILLTPRNVVSFVDAGTQALRRAAIRRVLNAGIFSYSLRKGKLRD